MGTARIVKLWSQDGQGDGYLLELRRQVDGSLSMQILAPVDSIELWLPGRSSVGDIAAAIAKSCEFEIPTPDGHYWLQRDQTRVLISHSEAKDATWKGSTAEILIALKELDRSVA